MPEGWDLRFALRRCSTTQATRALPCLPRRCSPAAPNPPSILLSADQRGNLSLTGPSLADSARAAFAALEGALRTQHAGLAEAA